jgi:hypothetical protein
MHKLYVLLAGVCMATGTMAQTDTTKPAPHSDTVRVGNLIIIKNGPRREEGNDTLHVSYHHRHHKSENVSTNWGIVDLGFSNYTDKTNYAGAGAQAFAPGSNGDWFSLRYGKSVNVNIWFFMQRRNLIEHVVNLKYGVGLELNNYRYDEPVLYDKGTNTFTMDITRHYRKNKLALDYVTVPLMLNFNFTPNKDNNKSFGFSAGISAGYLYSSRQKVITSEDGKQKTHDDFELNPFKISYVGEVQLGPVKLYGSLATKNMFKKGLDQTPYNFGIRLSNW